MEQSPVRQLHPIDYLKIVFRRKWLLILPVVVGIVCGLIAGNVLPKIYEASALVLVEEGKVMTYDMMKLPGKPDVFSKGAASTSQMADAIIAKLV